MRQDIAAARMTVVHDLPDLLNEAGEKLTKNGCRVHLAADAAGARNVLAGLLQGEKLAVRSYSKTLQEIGFDELAAGLNLKVFRTCVAEIVMDRLENNRAGYPPLPLINCAREETGRALQEELGAEGETSDLAELGRLLKDRIRENIIGSGVGVTGVNGLAAETGTLLLAEEEGNARNVSNLPPRHIAVLGIEKVHGTVAEALAAVCSAAAHGAGQKVPACISLISGPSRTGDIGFRLVYGMHGPREVHVVLLDNGRRFLLQQGFGDMLQCIDCGACQDMCRRMALENGWAGLFSLTMKGICLALVQKRIGPPEKTGSDEVACPAGIETGRFKQALLEFSRL